jgi:hypothetical protein
MMKHAAPDPQIHTLATAEINRQIQTHSARRQQILTERAAIYCSRT